MNTRKILHTGDNSTYQSVQIITPIARQTQENQESPIKGREEGSEGGLIRSLGTDHVISGPKRDLTKTAFDGANRQTNRQTDRHGDSMNESAQWCQFSKIHDNY